MSKYFYIFAISIFLFQSVFSQTQAEKKSLYKESKASFDKEDYTKALSLLLQYDSLYPENQEVIYRIGACYLNSEFERKKAIPYLERALKENKENLPSATFKDLAHLYHLDYQEAVRPQKQSGNV